MKRMWSVAVVLYLQKAYSAVVTLLAAVLISRAYGPVGLGDYSLYQTVLQIALVLGLFGANYRVIEYAPRLLARERAGFVSATMGGAVITGAASAGVLFGVLHLLRSSLASAFWVVLFAVLVAAVVGYFVSIDQQVVSSSLDAVVRPTGFVLVVVVGSYALRWSLPAVVNLGLGFAYIGTLILGLRVGGLSIGSPKLGLRFLRERTEWLGALTYTFMGVYSIVVSQADRIVASILVSKEQVGVYSAAQNVLNVIIYASTSLTALLLPVVARGMSGTVALTVLEDHMKRFARLLFLFALVSLLVAFLFSGLIEAVFGAGFSEMRGPMLILMGGLCVSFIFGFPQTTLSMSRNSRGAFLWVMGIWMVSSLGITYILTLKFGILGTSMANAIAAIGSRFSFFALVQRSVGIDVSILPHSGGRRRSA